MTQTPEQIRYPSLLDVLGPERGPCAFCGHKDARHRIADSIVEYFAAGMTVEEISAIYDLFGTTPDGVWAIVEKWRDES